ncbi:MAG: pimeloyl-CoA dehydrogenase large subunit [Mesorhizobium sp.]|nr:MAG: pimeloyl-CoA dehydrogenase large subunit [Mesorhizobium sp.]
MIDFRFSPRAESLRAEVREFCRANLPEELKVLTYQENDHPPRSLTDPWQRALAQQGWAAPRFPLEYGGTDWDDELHYAFEREMALCGAPRPDPAMLMIGPTILHYGSDAQKAAFLPPMLTGEARWCQGFSEPNAGSDLAAIQSSAVRDGDNYIVGGSKIWTTDGHTADWMFGIFRTDGSGKKQAGITFLLLDMRTPGIRIEPLITFGGHHIVNQIFFDDVRVPVTDRLGEEHYGWSVAKYLLTLERFGTAEVSRSLSSMRRLKDYARRVIPPSSSVEATLFWGELMKAETELIALEATEIRMLLAEGAAENLGPEASLLKVRGTEIQQRILELGHRILGNDGVVQTEEREGLNGVPHLTSYAPGARFNFRKTSIYSGSNEIQKNIIAKAVLGI